jgi:hypothetical protein
MLPIFPLVLSLTQALICAGAAGEEKSRAVISAAKISRSLAAFSGRIVVRLLRYKEFADNRVT